MRKMSLEVEKNKTRIKRKACDEGRIYSDREKDKKREAEKETI